MSVYQEAGILIIGSRLKRLSERFLGEVAKIYKLQDIHFEPAWFPVFFLLDSRGSLSLTEISQEIDVSHSAISQMITQLQKKKLVGIQQDESDARIKRIMLTEKGAKLLEQVHPVWEALKKSMVQVWPEDYSSARFLKLLSDIESRMSENFLSETTLGFLEPESMDVTISSAGTLLVKKLKKWLKAENLEYNIKESAVLVAQNKGEIVGFASYETEPGDIHICHLFVKKPFRRKGIALAMLRHLSQQFPDLVFRLEEGNIDLIKVLLKSGFSFKVK